MDAEAIAEKILPVVDDPKLADRYHWTAVSLAQGNAVIENHVSHPCPLPHLPPKGKQTVRYYGLYSNKTRGQPPLIPDRIIRPPEFSPNLKSQISNFKFQISNPLSSSSPRLRNNPPATCGEDARLQDTRAKTRIRDFIGGL
jgi:hypothetical protein